MMKCSNPKCKKEIEPGSRFCPRCETPVISAPGAEEDISGVQTRDIGYVDGSIKDKSVKAAPSVGEISTYNVINVSGDSEKSGITSVVRCEICGDSNNVADTFRCVKCCRDYLCRRHRDEEYNKCERCAADLRAEIRKRANLEKLEQLAGEAEAAGDLEKKLSLLDEMLSLTSNRKAILVRKAFVEKKLEHRRQEELGMPFSIFKNSIGMNFVLIPPGTFMMGSAPDEPGRNSDERQHLVILTKGYYLQATPATQAQWQAVMGSNPSHFKGCGMHCPVENVSWDHIQEFIQKLNQKEETIKYRLPSEAEWEYAARACSSNVYSFGINEALLSDFAWYKDNSSKKTRGVGLKKPNAFGLYDMHGNVWEFCQDWYGDYPAGPVTDPRGPSKGTVRVDRVGSWVSDARRCRSVHRGKSNPVSMHHKVGFRLAMDP